VRTLLTILCLVTVASAAEGEPKVTVSVDTPSRTCYEMERVSITLRLTLDLADFEARSVTLFNRPMDLQIKVRAPWLTDLPGAYALPFDAPPTGAETLSLVLNDRVVALPRVAMRDGVVTLALTREFLPSKPGVLAITTPVATFAWATEFEDDFVTGRRPVARTDARVTGEPLRISVRPIPVEGRPDLFSGAVGRFTVTASVEPTTIEDGDSLKLTLRIEGRGNLTHFDTPRFSEIPGFHVYGAIDDRASPVRTIVYDLTSTGGGVSGLPAITFPFFDPTPPGNWRTVKTPTFQVLWTGGHLSEVPCRVVDPEPTRGPGAIVVVLAVLLVVGGIGFVVVRVLRGKKAAPEPTPAEVFRGRVAGADEDLEAALAEYLATHLGCAPAAVISPDLAERLAAAGVPENLAARTATLIAGLVATRYGGEGNGDGRDAAIEVVGELDRVFARSSD